MLLPHRQRIDPLIAVKHRVQLLIRPPREHRRQKSLRIPLPSPRHRPEQEVRSFQSLPVQQRNHRRRPAIALQRPKPELMPARKEKAVQHPRPSPLRINKPLAQRAKIKRRHICRFRQMPRKSFDLLLINRHRAHRDSLMSLVAGHNSQRNPPHTNRPNLLNHRLRPPATCLPRSRGARPPRPWSSAPSPMTSSDKKRRARARVLPETVKQCAAGPEAPPYLTTRAHNTMGCPACNTAMVCGIPVPSVQGNT